MFGITNLLNPTALYLLIPIILIFIFLLFRRFVSDDVGDGRERRKFRLVILVTRLLVFSLLVVALAKPFGEVTFTTPGNPRILILVDNTTSMQVVDTSFMPSLKNELENNFPVTVKQISSGTRSDIADATLGYLEQDTNLLLITDGNTNYGTTFDDIALLAANLNSTISSIDLSTKEKEVGVWVTGPDSTVRGVNATYTVHVNNLGDQDVKLRVTVDGAEITNTVTNDRQFTFSRDFEEGTHKIIATVQAATDYYPQNNVFYKSVNVVKKPKILLVENTYDPMEQIVTELYDVTKSSSIPENVDDYYAIILNDMPANVPGVDRLADYLIDKEGGYYGNGLFVVGGFDSFDKGSYKGSLLETYLPVYVGKAARKRGSSNIAITIDFSGTTGSTYYAVRDPETGKIIEMRKEDSNVQAVNKALAASVIESLGPDNSVGVSVFTRQSATVQELQPLFRIKKELIEKIAKIAQEPGQSYFDIGLTGAYALLKDHTGSNNIIMITDGQTGSSERRQATLDTAKTLNARGVKIYVVGTGRNVDETFLKDVAYNGGGIYFPASQQNNLKILFGEPEESKIGDVFDLFIINQYHYITQGLELDASLYAYNQVIPKTNAIQLVTTQSGEPAVTAWNYGLGRVATLNVFSGNNNLGDILNKKNSILLTRIVNWAIGDPQRKEPYYIVIPDSRTGDTVDVTVKSDKYPTAEGMSFTRSGENQYRTSFLAEEPGFHALLGKEYAVNYELEYQNLGMNPRLEDVVTMTGGQVFQPDDYDDIIKFVNSASKRTKTEKTTIIWPFVLAAGLIFLTELFIRKFREYNLNK